MGGATQKGTFNCKCSEEITGIVKSLAWLAQVLKSMHRACPCKVEKAAEAKQSGTGLLARAQLSSKSACREQASCACHNRSKTQNKAKQKEKKIPLLASYLRLTLSPHNCMVQYKNSKQIRLFECSSPTL